MKKMISVLTLVLGIFLFLRPVAAETANLPITIQLDKQTQAGQVHLLVWKVDSTNSADTLYQLSNEELSQRYGKPFVTPTNDEKAQIVLTDLPDGHYYVRQAETNAGKHLVPFFIDVPKHAGQTINAKHQVEPQSKLGGYRFRKVSSQGGRLAGALFQVFQVNDSGQEEAIQRSGQDYVVMSDAEGNVEVSNLPFGRYLLREIKAPTGYQQLKEAIPFEITDYSNQESPKTIVNRPKKQPKIVVPYTGNAVVIGVIVAGFTTFLVGYYLVSSREKDEA
ncbi:MSCRAMM family protein [Streptococcus ovuberis]|uniref:SpaA-like prealbumin fold domain-containing protein n=1 Tax=Streptococcus ovuberis TaxID=1936207 RepID=A0A7X6MX22_9STRE|nr:prealbumin-like fold domain-containing protein [Streptococcus ovuberis]NKZ19947.1 hypothetical protein [Streptococcus ovuberis]